MKLGSGLSLGREVIVQVLGCLAVDRLHLSLVLATLTQQSLFDLSKALATQTARSVFRHPVGGLALGVAVTDHATQATLAQLLCCIPTCGALVSIKRVEERIGVAVDNTRHGPFE